jgi:hypothetical protein
MHRLLQRTVVAVCRAEAGSHRWQRLWHALDVGGGLAEAAMIRAELAWGLFELSQTAVPLRGLGGMATWFGIRLVMPPRAISGQSVEGTLSRPSFLGAELSGWYARAPLNAPPAS